MWSNLSRGDSSATNPDEQREKFESRRLAYKNEHETVQKKTFTKWINSHLSKLNPPRKVNDLYEDLKDGTNLISLLEYLSGEKLKKEDRKNLKKVHFLANVQTALEYLEKRKIRLVNVNPSDIVEGKPKIILGLTWTIILHFQIEEFEVSINKLLGIKASAKGSAKKCLLGWVEKTIQKANISVNDFGKSWQDGRAFTAMVENIDPGVIRSQDLENLDNYKRLQTIFDRAESDLGIPKLMDPEDVIEKPDEKSIMTYVAQFVQAYPEGKKINKQVKASDKDHERQLLEDQRNFISNCQTILTNLESKGEDACIEAILTTYPDYIKRGCNMRLLANLRLTGTLEPPIAAQTVAMENDWKTVGEAFRKILAKIDSKFSGNSAELARWLSKAEKCLIPDWPNDDVPFKEKLNLISRIENDHKQTFRSLATMRSSLSKIKSSKEPPNLIKVLESRLDTAKYMDPQHLLIIEFQEQYTRGEQGLAEANGFLEDWAANQGRVWEIKQLLDQHHDFFNKSKFPQVFDRQLNQLKDTSDRLKSKSSESSPGVVDRLVDYVQVRWNYLLAEIPKKIERLHKIIDEWKALEDSYKDLGNDLGHAEKDLTGGGDIRKVISQERLDSMEKKLAAILEISPRVMKDCRTEIAAALEETDHLMQNRLKKLKLQLMDAEERKQAEEKERQQQRELINTNINSMTDWLSKIEKILKDKTQCDSNTIKEAIDALETATGEIPKIEGEMKEISSLLSSKKNLGDDLPNRFKEFKNKFDKIVKQQMPTRLKALNEVVNDVTDMESGVSTLIGWVEMGEEIIQAVQSETDVDTAEKKLQEERQHFQDMNKRQIDLEAKMKLLSQIGKSSVNHVDTNEIQNKFDKLSKQMKGLVSKVGQLESSEKEFQSAMSRAKDWLNQTESQLSHLNNISVNEMEIQEKIKKLEELTKALPEGLSLCELAKKAAQSSMKQAGVGAQKHIWDEMESMEEKRDHLVQDLPASLKSLQSLLKKLKWSSQLRDEFNPWAQNIEKSLQEYRLQDNLNEKEECNDFYQKLLDDVKVNENLAHDYSDSLKKLEEDGVEEDVNSGAIMEQYNQLLNQAKNVADQCKANLQDHLRYEKAYQLAKKLIDSVDSNRDLLSQKTTSRSICEDQMSAVGKVANSKDQINDQLNLVDQTAEDIYPTTGKKGCDVIKKDLKLLHDQWRALTELTNSSQKRLDKTMKEMDDVETGAAGLSAWINDMRHTLQEYLSGGDSLEERKQRAENLKKFLSELEKEGKTIDDLLKKARELGDKEMEQMCLELQKSYQELLAEANVANKNSDSMFKAHKAFDDEMSKFNDWMRSLTQEFESANDLTGDKAKLKSRLDKLKDFDKLSRQAEAKLSSLEARLKQLGSNSEEENQLKSVHSDWAKFNQSVQESRSSLTNFISDWSKLESSNEKLLKWLNETESFLKSRGLENTLKDKENVLGKYERLQTDVNEKEKSIQDCVRLSQSVSNACHTDDKYSTNLLNRYHSLRELSDTTAHSCKLQVQNHRNYSDNVGQLKTNLNKFQQKKQLIQSKPVTSDMRDQKKSLLTEFESIKESNNELLNQIISKAEHLYNETGKQGIEKIKGEIKSLQESWSSLQTLISNSQNELDHVVESLNELQDKAKETSEWLHNMMNEIQAASQGGQSLEDKQIRSEKLKALLEELTREGKTIDDILKRARELGDKDLEALCIDLQKQYKSTLGELNGATRQSENALKSHKDFEQDIEAFQKWKEGVMKQLEGCDNSTGDKETLKERFAKLKDIEKISRQANTKFASLESKSKQLDPDSHTQEEVDVLKFDWLSYLTNMEESKNAIGRLMDTWNNVDNGAQKWFALLDSFEKSLKSRQLENTLKDKENVLMKFEKLLKDMKDKQPEIQELDKQANQLAVETRTSNKHDGLIPHFKELEEQAEEVFDSCKRHVENHANYHQKVSDFKASIEAIQRKKPLLEAKSTSKESRDEKKEAIAQFQNQQSAVFARLEEITQIVQEIYPETGVQGREVIHLELQALEEMWASLVTLVDTGQEELNSTLNQMSRLGGDAKRIDDWISRLGEELVEAKAGGQSLEEKEKRAIKLKNLLAEIENGGISIDDLLKRARELGDKDMEELCQELKTKYNNLLGEAKETTELGGSNLSAHKNFLGDMGRFSDWKVNIRKQFEDCSDLTGNEETLKSRYDKLKAIEKCSEEAESRLDQLEKQAKQLGAESGAYEDLERARDEWRHYLDELLDARNKLEGGLFEFQTFKDRKGKYLVEISKIEEAMLNCDLKSTAKEKWSQFAYLDNLKKTLFQKGEDSEFLGQQVNQIYKICKDNGIVEEWKESQAKIEKLISDLKELSNRWKGFAENHEQFDQAYENANNWLTNFLSRFNKFLNWKPTNKDETESKLKSLNQLMDEKEEGGKLLQQLEHLMHQVLPNTSPQGSTVIRENFDQLLKIWNSCRANLEQDIEEVKVAVDQWRVFNEWDNSLSNWLTEMEQKVQNEKALLDTLIDKQERIPRVNALIDAISSNEATIKGVVDKANEMSRGGYTLSAEKAKEDETRFRNLFDEGQSVLKLSQSDAQEHSNLRIAFDKALTLLNSTKENLAAVSQKNDRDSINDRIAFMERLEQHKKDIANYLDDAKQVSDIVIPRSGQQGRKLIIDELKQLEVELHELFMNVTEKKKDLESTNQGWQQFETQFDQFEKWMTDMEEMLKNNSELGSDLEEKENQLKVAKKCHSEIVSLRDSFEDIRASLEPLMQSSPNKGVEQKLKKLLERYNNAENNSEQLVERMHKAIQEHIEYAKANEEAQGFLKHLQSLVDANSSFKVDQEILKSQLLKLDEISTSQIPELEELISSVARMNETVQLNTNSRGKKNLKSEADNLKEGLTTLKSELSKCQETADKTLEQWQKAERRISEIQAHLQNERSEVDNLDNAPNTRNKSEKLERARALMEDIERYEPTLKSGLKKLSDFSKQVASVKLSPLPEQITADYEDIRQTIAAKVAKLEASVNGLQSYSSVKLDFEKWLRKQLTEFEPCSSNDHGNVDCVESCLQQAEGLFTAAEEEGVAKLLNLMQTKDQVLEVIDDEMKPIIFEEVSSLDNSFTQYRSNLTSCIASLDNCLNHYNDYHKAYDTLNTWLKSRETVLQSEPELKSTVLEKKHQIEKFKKIQEELLCKTRDIDDITGQADELLQISNDAKISKSLSKLRSRFDAAAGRFTETIQKLEKNCADHEQFESLIDDFYDWSKLIRGKLSQINRQVTTRSEMENIVAVLQKLEKESLPKGRLCLQPILQIKDEVIKSTSTKGVKLIGDQVDSAQKEFKDIESEISTRQEYIESTSKLIIDFESMYNDIVDWLSQMESKVHQDLLSIPSVSERKIALKHLQDLKPEIERKKTAIEKLSKMGNQIEDGTILEKSNTVKKRYDRLLVDFEEMLDSLERSVSGQEEFLMAENKFNDWLSQTRSRLQNLSNLKASKKNLKHRCEDFRPLLVDINSTGRELLDKVKHFSDVIVQSRAFNADEVSTKLAEHQNEFDSLIRETTRSESDVANLLHVWEEFSNLEGQLNEWMKDSEQKLEKANDPINGGLEMTHSLSKDYQLLYDSIVTHRVDLNRLSDLADQLKKISQDSEAQTRNEDVTSSYETLNNKCKKTMEAVNERLEAISREQKAFNKSYEEAVHWLEIATQKLLYCSDHNSPLHELMEKRQIVKDISKSLNDGQQLMSAAIESGEKVLRRLIGSNSKKSADKVAKQIEELKSDWTELQHQIHQVKQSLDKWITKIQEFEKRQEGRTNWMTEAERNLDRMLEVHGQRNVIGSDERTNQFEKLKTIQKELEREGMEFHLLQNLSDEIVGGTSQMEFDKATQDLVTRYHKLQELVSSRLEKMRKLQLDHATYRDFLQTAEQWILQKSFQLMNENSATTVSLTEAEQLVEGHGTLMREMERYNQSIGHVESLAQALVEAYRLEGEQLGICSAGNDEIISEIEKELSELKASYQNLCDSAQQIKVRLGEYLNYWRQFRDLLEDGERLMANYLPNWWSGKDPSWAESSDECQNQLQETKELIDKLRTMKTDLSSAAHRCDSQPSSSLSDRKTRSSFNTILPKSESFSESSYGRRADKVTKGMNDTMHKLQKRLSELEELQRQWDSYDEIREEFAHWLNSKQEEAQCYTQPVQNGVDNSEIKTLPLEEFLVNYQDGNQMLKNIEIRHSELVSQHPTAEDPRLKSLRDDYEELQKKLSKYLKEGRPNGMNEVNDQTIPQIACDTGFAKRSNDEFTDPRWQQSQEGDGQMGEDFLNRANFRPISAASYNSELERANGFNGRAKSEDASDKAARAAALRCMLSTVRSLKNDTDGEACPYCHHHHHHHDHCHMGHHGHHHHHHHPEVHVGAIRPEEMESIRRSMEVNSIRQSKPRSSYSPTRSRSKSPNYRSKSPLPSRSKSPSIASYKPTLDGASAKRGRLPNNRTSSTHSRSKPRDKYGDNPPDLLRTAGSLIECPACHHYHHHHHDCHYHHPPPPSLPPFRPTPPAYPPNMVRPAATMPQMRPVTVQREFVQNYDSMLRDSGNFKAPHSVYRPAAGQTHSAKTKNYESLKKNLDEANLTAHKLRQLSDRLGELSRHPNY